MTKQLTNFGDRDRHSRESAWTGSRTYGRVGALGILFFAASTTFAACGSPNSPQVAHLGNDSGKGSTRTTTSVPAGNPTALIDEWAACMRRHGDPQQADPSIDTHGVINIVVPTSFSTHQFGEDLHNITGACSQYLASAQNVIRQEIPYTPFNPDNAALVQYADCMRTNGVANYPSPSGSETNLLNVNTNSPTFIHANVVCGRQIKAPAWWINGWGPPGDVSSSSGPVPGSGSHPNRASAGG